MTRTIRAAFTIVGLIGALIAAAPAQADEDGPRWRHHEWRDHHWHGWGPPVVRYAAPVPRYFVAPPPAYYVPPPAYYPPPPLVYGSPGVSIGLSFH